MDPYTTLVATGIGLGVLGGGLRALLGAYKGYLETKKLVVDKVALSFNITFGLIAGGIGSGLRLLDDPLSLLLAGYGGADFIEGILATKPGFKKRMTGK